MRKIKVVIKNYLAIWNLVGDNYPPPPQRVWGIQNSTCIWNIKSKADKKIQDLHNLVHWVKIEQY